MVSVTHSQHGCFVTVLILSPLSRRLWAWEDAVVLPTQPARTAEKEASVAAGEGGRAPGRGCTFDDREGEGHMKVQEWIKQESRLSECMHICRVPMTFVCARLDCFGTCLLNTYYVGYCTRHWRATGKKTTWVSVLMGLMVYWGWPVVRECELKEGDGSRGQSRPFVPAEITSLLSASPALPLDPVPLTHASSCQQRGRHKVLEAADGLRKSQMPEWKLRGERGVLAHPFRPMLLLVWAFYLLAQCRQSMLIQSSGTK